MHRLTLNTKLRKYDDVLDDMSLNRWRVSLQTMRMLWINLENDLKLNHLKVETQLQITDINEHMDKYIDKQRSQ